MQGLHSFALHNRRFSVSAKALLARYFAAKFNAMMNAEMRRFRERPPELQPAIDALEVSLVRVFLRRYTTYCARRRRFGAMNGAARLYAAVCRSAT